MKSGPKLLLTVAACVVVMGAISAHGLYRSPREGTYAAVDGFAGYGLSSDPSQNLIVTIAGTNNGSTGEGIPAALVAPLGVVDLAADAEGNIFVAESTRIRKITRDGLITTVAGGGSTFVESGSATSTSMNPAGFALDPAGNLYIANSNRIRKISPDGTIRTIAGTGNPGFAGDGGAAASAQLNGPMGLTVDTAGNVFICDTLNNRIRRAASSAPLPAPGLRVLPGMAGRRAAVSWIGPCGSPPIPPVTSLYPTRETAGFGRSRPPG